jgi:hypothetical protein
VIIERSNAMAQQVDSSPRTRTVHIVAHSSLPPERVLEAGCDFSPRRGKVFSAVQPKYFILHEVGETTADVTEGTRAGPIVYWERCRYDWSQPGVVRAKVIDSNIYDVLPSLWELRATADEDGSRVEMIWVRAFNRRPKGRIFGFAFRHFGEKLFGKYVREIIGNLEQGA